MDSMPDYVRFIEENLAIVDKTGTAQPFVLNSIQRRYLSVDVPVGKPHLVLKARQQGFSSVILARFLADFIFKENSRSVVVADIAENASTLLARLKFYLDSYNARAPEPIPLKYNSKNELVNGLNGSVYTIGTAKNAEFGRSQTITNLHLSESAFYPDLDRIKAGAGNAVVPGGYYVMETTANGFNAFKGLWDDSVKGESGFVPLFYGADEFYDAEFLNQKKRELKEKFRQEFPNSPIEAFITSGSPYFDRDALEWYDRVKLERPLSQFA